MMKHMVNEEPLISRRILFGNPDKYSLKVSHDGERISFIAPRDGIMNIWIAPRNNPSAADAVTCEIKRGICSYFWAYNNEQVLYLQDQDGDEGWQIYAVDIEGREHRNLTPFEEISGPDGLPMRLPGGKKLRPMAQVMHQSHCFPDEILITLNKRVAEFYDVYRLNTRSGQLTLLEHNDIYAGFLAGDDFKLRCAFKVNTDGSAEYHLPDEDGEWRWFEDVPGEDVITTEMHAVDSSGEVLYLSDSRGRNTAALVSFNLKTRERCILHADERADISGMMMHPRKKIIDAAAVNYTRTEWTVLDEAVRSDMEFLQTVCHGEITILSRSLDDSIWTVAFEKDKGPVGYYLYDRENKQADFLFTNRTQLEGKSLVPMHPEIISARDGLKLVSYLTLPRWADPEETGRPSKALPMILLPHGGPWWRDSWGYDPFHQWLANRGYAVLSVNFRGSTGFGKDFINASIREWGGKMHDDLIDAVDWAVANSIAARRQIAIVGGSYGGYAALAGITFTPDVFVCSVDICGVSNLCSWMDALPPNWGPWQNLCTVRVGDHRTESGRAFLKSRSPLTFVDQIKKPLLIIQGANDPRVKQEESDQIANALQEKDIPVTYLLYSDEGHGFLRPENRLSSIAIMDGFLSRHLGGRAEPIGDDLNGSSLSIKTGAEHISEMQEDFAL